MTAKRPLLDDDVRLMDGRRGVVIGIAEGDRYAVLIHGQAEAVRVEIKDIAGVIAPGFRTIDRPT